MPLLLILACACFVSALVIRIVDPLVPTIAADLQTAEANVSLLASAYAIPYALIQPILGPIGDKFGKALIMNTCLLCLALSTLLSAFATSYEMILTARVLGGLAGGGIIPLALASAGDHVPFDKRQLALSKILSAMIFATLLGTIGVGLLATYVGWRGVFVCTSLVCFCVFILSVYSLRTSVRHGSHNTPKNASMLAGYKTVLANQRAYICYTAVFIEGVFIFGLLPYVASLLLSRGAGGTVEAGIVLSGMALGGLAYTQIATRFINQMGGITNLIRLGGILAAFGYACIALESSWHVDMLAFMLLGFGFYSIHNSLQTEATELAPANRGAAVALHAFFFFLGQSLGPIFYAAAFQIAAPSTTVAVIAGAALALAFLLAHALRRKTH